MALENASPQQGFYLGKPLVLLLPFQQYTLCWSHRLLNSLGGVSRFLLSAAAAKLSLCELTDITALSSDVLQKQWEFLYSSSKRNTFLV